MVARNAGRLTDQSSTGLGGTRQRLPVRRRHAGLGGGGAGGRRGAERRRGGGGRQSPSQRGSPMPKPKRPPHDRRTLPAARVPTSTGSLRDEMNRRRVVALRLAAEAAPVLRGFGWGHSRACLQDALREMVKRLRREGAEKVAR